MPHIDHSLYGMSSVGAYQPQILVGFLVPEIMRLKYEASATQDATSKKTHVKKKAKGIETAEMKIMRHNETMSGKQDSHGQKKFRWSCHLWTSVLLRFLPNPIKLYQGKFGMNDINGRELASSTKKT